MRSTSLQKSFGPISIKDIAKCIDKGAIPSHLSESWLKEREESELFQKLLKEEARGEYPIRPDSIERALKRLPAENGEGYKTPAEFIQFLIDNKETM